jgi:hypothetical protein
LAWILVAAGFAPSAYGQGYPVERMRFLARTITIAVFMLEGVLLALITRQVQFKFHAVPIQWIAAILFSSMSIFYPLRTAAELLRYDVPEYRERAELWDLREEFIKRRIAEGETDLVIPGFSGIYGVKELDDNPAHWINACAARYYGVNSIRTVGVEEEELREVLSD